MASEKSHTVTPLLDGIIFASEGAGPLFQRDYWAVIRNCRVAPLGLAEILSTEFCSFAPDELVRFDREVEVGSRLRVGEEIDVKIRMAGSCRVRVLHRDANSLTLGTLQGHPEAGRITFGAYRNTEGEVIFHIRSRARASTPTRYAGWLAAGEPMQTNTWTDFIDRVAHAVGDGVVGAIHVETTEMEDDISSPEEVCSPTFLAVGE